MSKKITTNAEAVDSNRTNGKQKGASNEMIEHFT